MSSDIGCDVVVTIHICGKMSGTLATKRYIQNMYLLRGSMLAFLYHLGSSFAVLTHSNGPMSIATRSSKHWIELLALGERQINNIAACHRLLSIVTHTLSNLKTLGNRVEVDAVGVEQNDVAVLVGHRCYVDGDI